MEKGKEKMKGRAKVVKKKKKLRENKKHCIDEINDKIKEKEKMEIAEKILKRAKKIKEKNEDTSSIDVDIDKKKLKIGRC